MWKWCKGTASINVGGGPRSRVFFSFCELVVRRLVAWLIDEAHYLPAVMESLYVQLLPLWGGVTALTLFCLTASP